MLVQGVNDGEESLQSTASHIEKMIPCCAYISIPTRPPMGKWVKSPSADSPARAYSIFSGYLGPVELLTGYEGNGFASTGDPEADILDISAVHPMRKDAVEELLARTGAKWSLIEDLLEDGKNRKANWDGQDFFIRTPLSER